MESNSITGITPTGSSFRYTVSASLWHIIAGVFLHHYEESRDHSATSRDDENGFFDDKFPPIVGLSASIEDLFFSCLFLFLTIFRSLVGCIITREALDCPFIQTHAYCTYMIIIIINCSSAL